MMSTKIIRMIIYAVGGLHLGSLRIFLNYSSSLPKAACDRNYIKTGFIGGVGGGGNEPQTLFCEHLAGYSTRAVRGLFLSVLLPVLETRGERHIAVRLLGSNPWEK